MCSDKFYFALKRDIFVFFNTCGNSTIPVSPQFDTCSKMRRAFHYNKNGKEAVDALYEYTKRNLLWLNVYVKVCNC